MQNLGCSPGFGNLFLLRCRWTRPAQSPSLAGRGRSSAPTRRSIARRDIGIHPGDTSTKTAVVGARRTGTGRDGHQWLCPIFLWANTASDAVGFGMELRPSRMAQHSQCSGLYRRRNFDDAHDRAIFSHISFLLWIGHHQPGAAGDRIERRAVVANSLAHFGWFFWRSFFFHCRRLSRWPVSK